MVRPFALLALAFTHTASAQLQNAHWFLGASAVSFASGQPLPAAQPFGLSAMASIASTTGDLIAAADTGRIYNASGQIMLNGSGLLPSGHNNGLFNNMILPFPGHPDQFWLFHLGHQLNQAPDQRFFATRFDAAAAGGLGTVLDKNIVLWDTACPFMTAIPDTTLDRYWVIQHEPHTNHFLAFELNDQGISFNPVVSPVGMLPASYLAPHQLANRSLGASPTGDRLVMCRQYTNSGASTMVEVFDFDPATGLVSNPITLDGPARFHDAEFDASGALVYVVEYIHTGPIANRLWQYDVTLPDSAAIAATKTLLFELDRTPANPGLSKLELAPDGKVYVGQGGNGIHQLGAISPPDVPGAPSTYVHQAVLTPTGTGGTILPNTLKTFLPASTTATAGNERPPSLGLFPNPASDQLQVSLPMDLPRVSHFVMRDATGRLVRQWPASSGQTNLLLHGTAPGCYLLQAVDQRGRSLAQGRVVVQ